MAGKGREAKNNEDPDNEKADNYEEQFTRRNGRKSNDNSERSETEVNMVENMDSKDVSKAASTSFVRFWSSAVGRRGSRQNAMAVTYGALDAR